MLAKTSGVIIALMLLSSNDPLVATLTRPGGVILYATCSPHVAETASCGAWGHGGFGSSSGDMP